MARPVKAITPPPCHRLRRWAASVAALLAVCGVAQAAPKATAPKTYTILVQDMGGGNQGAQMKELIQSMGQVVAKTTGLVFKVQVTNRRELYRDALKRGQPDFAFGANAQSVEHLPPKGAYRLLLTYEALGFKENPLCLLTARTSNARSVKDLRKRGAVTYSGYWEYLLLKDFLGEAPDTFFDPLKPSPNGSSSIYALNLGQVDVAVVGREALTMMKRLNPGPLKKVRLLACTRPSPNSPMLVHHRVPPAHAQLLAAELKNVMTQKAYERFWPLLRKLQLRFLTVPAQHYQWVRDRLEKGRKNQELQQYQTWMQYMGKGMEM